MAATLYGEKSAVQRAFIVLRQTVNPSMFMSTSSTSPASAAALASASVASKPKRPKKKNMFEVVQFLPNWGLGYKVAKTTWRDVSYQVTKINLYKDGRHGKAWGIRFKAGVQAADAPMRISGVNKRGWKYIKEAENKVKEISKAPEQALA